MLLDTQRFADLLRRRWCVTAVCGGMAIGVIVGVACADTTPPTDLATVTANPSGTQSSGPIAIPSGLPSAKAKSLEAANATIQAAREHPVPKSTPPALPTTNPPTRQAGIDDAFHQSPVGQSFTVENFWQGPTNDSTWSLIYAGGKVTGVTSDANGRPHNETEGGVWLSTETGDPSSPQFKVAQIGFIPAPVATPSVRITSWPSADMVELETVSDTGVPTGTTMDFNAVTHEYSNVRAS